ncbi:hypothetical protein SAY86_019707 [Trapa natans]|uniref:DUF7054 domain-containing protein n=1 Tax=Trapa natans TaxID=22666 RepID=A0AAN7R719_TRANT|nr:hypothetical protein SAY86_019707 [Trapa natans]
MPNSKIHRRGVEAGKDQSRRGRLTEKASSYHGKSMMDTEAAKQLRRPKTVPDLRSAAFSIQSSSAGTKEERPRLTKLLLNVTVQGSVGPVQAVITSDSTVGDLIAKTVQQYLREGRRPVLPTVDPAGFDLHYSQFSLESIRRDAELITLGSRNFFLYHRRPPVANTEVAAAVAGPGSPCSKEAIKTGFNWLKFMDFSSFLWQERRQYSYQYY